MRNLLVGLVISTISGQFAYGQVLQSVQLQEVSSSQRSIIIDQGTRHGIELGAQALFIKAISPTTFHKQLVGLAQAVKVLREQSVWYFTKTADTEYLIKGELLEVFTAQDALQGLMAPQVFRHLRVVWPGSPSPKTNTRPSGKDPGIVKRGDGYDEMELPRRSVNQEAWSYHQHLLDLAEWTEDEESWGSFYAVTNLLAPSSEKTKKAMEEQRHLNLGWHLIKLSRWWHGEQADDQESSQGHSSSSSEEKPEAFSWFNWSNPFE